MLTSKPQCCFTLFFTSAFDWFLSLSIISFSATSCYHSIGNWHVYFFFSIYSAWGETIERNRSHSKASVQIEEGKVHQRPPKVKLLCVPSFFFHPPRVCVSLHIIKLMNLMGKREETKRSWLSGDKYFTGQSQIPLHKTKGGTKKKQTMIKVINMIKSRGWTWNEWKYNEIYIGKRFLTGYCKLFFFPS